MVEIIQPATKTKAIKQHKCSFCLQPIEKGSIYIKSVCKIDDIYTWKAHEHCEEIADKLNMYSHVDYGVTDEDFFEEIKYEYMKIMSKHHTEIYESKDFVYPSFQEQLLFVLNHHGITTKQQ